MAKADKLSKAERKRLAAEEPLRFRDRRRALWEAVDLGRRIIEDLDKNVRYAMVIFGAMNAAVFLAITRTPLLRQAASPVRSLLLFLGILYAVASIGVLTHSIRSLIPRRSGSEHFPVGGAGSLPDPSSPAPPPRLLYWGEILGQDLASYQRLWRKVRGERLNDELAEVLHGLAQLVRVKCASLRRLYLGLVALLVLGALITVLMIFTAAVGPA